MEIVYSVGVLVVLLKTDTTKICRSAYISSISSFMFCRILREKAEKKKKIRRSTSLFFGARVLNVIPTRPIVNARNVTRNIFVFRTWKYTIFHRKSILFFPGSRDWHAFGKQYRKTAARTHDLDERVWRYVLLGIIGPW